MHELSVLSGISWSCINWSTSQVTHDACKYHTYPWIHRK